MSNSLRGAVLCVLLCVWYGGVCPVLAQYQCPYDKIIAKQGGLPIAVVQELPRSGQSAWQAYTAAAPEWEPIRFKIFTEDLKRSTKYCTKEGDIRPDFTGETVRCKKEDILTSSKMDLLTRILLPEATKLHADRLLVQRINVAVRVPIFTQGFCSQFAIDVDHHTKGVSGADMLLYVAAGPTEETTAAWAAPCGELKNKRPVVGVVNYGPRFISVTRESIRSCAHEIAHALGFNYGTMQQMKMISRTADIRGKGSLFVVSSERTRAKAREHYGCNTLAGMELEDEGTDGTAHSHWERRNAKDELMSPSPSAGYYTALTMSAFEDMGVYRAQWGMEEPMSWGHKAGCSLLDDKCLTDGVTSHPDMFCSEKSSTLLCTSDRRALGHCPIVEYVGPLPRNYQYFKKDNIGGKRATLMDICPIIEPYVDSSCITGRASSMPGSIVGPSSACLKSVALRWDSEPVGDVCAEVLCGERTVHVRYLGNDTWHLCPEGAHITPGRPFTHGRILCPRRLDVCAASHISERDLHEREMVRLRGTS